MSSDLVTTIYNDIENKILGGVFKPDEVITELGLAKEYGVSRTPVREVIRLLSANDLVYLDESKKNMCVRSFTHKDMLDIYDLRIMMEGLSAKLCAAYIDEDTLDKLHETVCLQEMYLEQNKTDKIWELDDMFHNFIHAGSKNRLLKKMLDDFHHYTKYVRKYSYDAPGRRQISVNEHKDIYIAIKNGEADKAEKLMHNHVTQVKLNILSHGFNDE